MAATVTSSSLSLSLVSEVRSKLVCFECGSHANLFAFVVECNHILCKSCAENSVAPIRCMSCARQPHIPSRLLAELSTNWADVESIICLKSDEDNCSESDSDFYVTSTNDEIDDGSPNCAPAIISDTFPDLYCEDVLGYSSQCAVIAEPKSAQPLNIPKVSNLQYLLNAEVIGSGCNYSMIKILQNIRQIELNLEVLSAHICTDNSELETSFARSPRGGRAVIESIDPSLRRESVSLKTSSCARMVVLTSGLSPNGSSMISQAVAAGLVQVWSPSLNTNPCALIVEAENRRAPLTLKFLKALCLGLFIIDLAWVTNSLECGYARTMNDFEVIGCIGQTRDGIPALARIQRHLSSGRSNLFSCWCARFITRDENSIPRDPCDSELEQVWSLDTVKWLWLASGGKIIDSEAQPLAKHVQIVVSFHAVRNVTSSNLVPTRNLGWLLNCICTQEVIL